MQWMKLRNQGRTIRLNVRAIFPAEVLKQCLGHTATHRHPAPFNKTRRGQERRAERRFAREQRLNLISG